MRKVKFAQDAFHEKLDAILTEFPILNVSHSHQVATISTESITHRTSTLSSLPSSMYFTTRIITNWL